MTSFTLSDASCLLFVPGHRPDRFAKALAACPQGIVIDLEDAVPLSQKDEARDAVASFLKSAGLGTPVMVRLNPLGTRAGLEDLAALADGNLPAAGLFLAKVETPRDIELVRAYLPAHAPLLAAIETAAAILAAPSIARALLPDDALGFGGADLAADLGALFAWEPLLAARCAVVTAAASVGAAVFDVPYLDIADVEGLRSETRRVRSLGFTGKLAIHPAQVAPIVEAFMPDESEIERARRVVAALDAAGGEAALLDGRMIDLPVAVSARRILARLTA